MGEHACRACRSREGSLVLDLGRQPACDHFPPQEDPGPDPEYPLQMWLCAACGLAQLVADPTVPEEPRGAEPAALIAQAAEAVERVAAAGLMPAGGETRCEMLIDTTWYSGVFGRTEAVSSSFRMSAWNG